MACDECRDLNAHEFGSFTDLVHAVQVAAAEVDRGVLVRIHREELTAAEREAVYSALGADAVPATLRYRFKCAVCGDRFELWADTSTGRGGWTREPDG